MEYELLGANPHPIDDSEAAFKIRQRHLASETHNVDLQVMWRGYLEECFDKAKQVLAADGNV
jgi:hypothetical protein